MKLVGFAGYSGSGKTTLVEQLVARLAAAGQRVAVLKHAHHAFDIDHPGKDSWRHRQAGASQVVVASDRRIAVIRERDAPAVPTLEALLRELEPCDWVLVEGFKHAPIPKIEVWRAAAGHPPLYPADPFIVAVATTDDALPQPTSLPVLSLDDPDAVLRFLLQHAEGHDNRFPQA